MSDAPAPQQIDVAELHVVGIPAPQGSKTRMPNGAMVEGSSNAKRVCATCPVKQQCLEYALEHGEHHGIWGGTSERERRRLRRARRIA